MPSEMVRRVAAVIAQIRGLYPDDARCVLLAEAVIAEMREPTEAMINVVKYDEYDWGANNWRAMIDKALE